MTSMTAATGAAAVIETHSAVVFLVGDRAYKMKKPVDLGFLDFSELADRERAVSRELELNRRLAPDVYLGCATVRNDQGQVTEHLLVMRRLPSDRRLDVLLAGGEDITTALAEVAATLASFQAAHPLDDATTHAVADPKAISLLWAGCTSGIREWGDGVVGPRNTAEVERLSDRFIAGRTALFDQRIQQGFIRDGHGDLQASDIFVLPDGPRLLDCLDFDQRLRVGDVVSDIAFLAMDLERLGHPRLAAVMLQGFLTLSPAPPPLVHFYLAYRAWVRCEVSCLRSAQAGVIPGSQAAELAAQTLRHLGEARVRLICVGGLPGSGKSTIAAGLIQHQPDWQLIGSDLSRGDPDAPDRYAETARDRVYDEMLGRARTLLELGHTVVLDATWAAGNWRDAAAALATETCADLIVLDVTCSTERAAARILSRGPTRSEATVAVLHRMAAGWVRWPGSRVVDTMLTPEQAIAAAQLACL